MLVDCKKCERPLVFNKENFKPSKTCSGGLTRTCRSCQKSKRYNSYEEKFWSKVDITEGDNCWLWKGRKTPLGYGVLFTNGRRTGAHRMAFKLSVKDPIGLMVCHKCDNPACCNPNHLFLGTAKDNMSDKCAKGRQPAGEDIKNSLLTPDLVRQIRNLARDRKALKLSFTKIGEMFGIGRTHVQKIHVRKLWKQVSDQVTNPDHSAGLVVESTTSLLAA